MKTSKFIFSPATPNEQQQKNVTKTEQKKTAAQSTTNKIILDYLLYLSIQSRLKQARVELLELSSPLPQSKEEISTIEKRKQRWTDTASKAEQDKNAVESIVAGILSSHCNKTPSFQIDCNFEQRLHLCQLTNLVFGRFDALSTGQHVIAHKTSRLRRHETQMAVVIETDIHDEPCDIKQRQQIFARPILPPYCRRHRIQNCYGCRSPYLKEKPENALKMAQLHQLEEKEEEEEDTTKEEDKATAAAGSAEAGATAASIQQQQSFKTLDLANISPPTPPAGLIEAIPCFLRTSADMLRRTLESGDAKQDDGKPMMFAGQKVMGGGMPPRWYDLFLELLTQAAIESYLCDTQAGLEPIFEIFSYGDVEDEDHVDEVEDSDEEDDEEEEGHNEEEEEEEQQEVDEWGIRAADHHLLFPKTRTMYLFKTQVREREKDFLVVEAGVDLDTHFQKLAQRFPLETFEKSMGEFIQMILDTMDVPALDKYEQGMNTTEKTEQEPGTSTSCSSGEATTTTGGGPSVYKYPGDGSLLMPEISDEDEKSSSPSSVATTPITSQPVTKKRPAAESVDEGQGELENKRLKEQ